MKVTIKQLYESNGALITLLKSPLLPKLGDNLIAKFNKVVSEVAIPIQEHSINMEKLIKELGTEKEEGRYEIPPKKEQEFKDRKAELEKVEIEIDIPEFNLSEFVTSIIPPDHLRALQNWMIDVNK